MKPFNKQKNVIEKYKDNFKTKFHKSNATCADNFIAVYLKSGTNIVPKLDSAHAIQIDQNRKKLLLIIKRIMFYGRQEMPLRGIDDYGTHTLNDSKPVNNNGNFLALWRMRVSSEDQI